MKKTYLSIALLATLALAGCKGDYDDWALPQHNEQEEPANVEMSVEVKALSSVIELENETGDSVQVFDPVQVHTNVAATLQLTLSDTQGNSRTFATSPSGRISREELVTAIAEIYGKKQVEREMTGKLQALYVQDGVSMTSTSEAFTVKVLPAVPDLNYWIYGKQNNRDSKTKTLPLMPVTKELQTVTTYFSGRLDTKLWSDDTFGNSAETMGATGGNKSTFSGEFSVGGGYINSPSAGWYTLSFNFATYTYQFTRLENQTPTAYTSISLIGDFNSWGADLELTPVATTGSAWTSHYWYAESVTLSGGALKFRADKDWTVAWGGGQNVKDTPYGVGDTTAGGPNITVPAGTYNVYFNDITAEFLFIEQ